MGGVGVLWNGWPVPAAGFPGIKKNPAFKILYFCAFWVRKCASQKLFTVTLLHFLANDRCSNISQIMLA